MTTWRIFSLIMLGVVFAMGLWINALRGDLHDMTLDYRLEHARVTNLLDLGNFLDTVAILKDSLPSRWQENQWLYLDMDRYVCLVGLPSLGEYRCDYRCRDCRYYRELRLHP